MKKAPAIPDKRRISNDLRVSDWVVDKATVPIRLALARSKQRLASPLVWRWFNLLGIESIV